MERKSSGSKKPAKEAPNQQPTHSPATTSEPPVTQSGGQVSDDVDPRGTYRITHNSGTGYYTVTVWHSDPQVPVLQRVCFTLQELDAIMDRVDAVSDFRELMEAPKHSTQPMTREPSPPKLPRAPTTAPPKMPRQRTSHPLLDFYNPGINSTDENGCTLAEMMGWEDSLLERRQDYIRWLFPLPEESMLIHNTPAVNREVVDQFRNSDVLKHKMIMSFLKMINFYGFTISPYPEGDSAKDRKQKTRQYKIVNPPTTAGSSATQPFTLPPLPVMGYYVVRGPNWKTASRNWCTHIDHNHLRITRILRSLRIFGIQNQSEALYDALKRAYRDPKTKIGKNSMMFWRRAVRNELHIGPGGERIPWLKEEVERPPVAPAVGEGTGDATDETKDETKDKKEDNTDETKDETKDKKEDKKEEPEVEAEKADRQL